MKFCKGEWLWNDEIKFCEVPAKQGSIFAWHRNFTSTQKGGRQEGGYTNETDTTDLSNNKRKMDEKWAKVILKRV